MSVWIATEDEGWLNAERLLRLTVGVTDDGRHRVTAHTESGSTFPVETTDTRDEADCRVRRILYRLHTSHLTS